MGQILCFEKLNMYIIEMFVLQTKGELSTERRERYEAAQQAFQKLMTNAITFSVSIYYIHTGYIYVVVFVT